MPTTILPKPITTNNNTYYVMSHTRSMCAFTLCTILTLAGITYAQDSLNLRIMSFNVRYGTADDGEDKWEFRKGMVVDLLRREAPDVLGVQEVLRFQLDDIRDGLPGYNEVGVGRDDGKAAGEYAAILFRANRFRSLSNGTFWFSDSPDVPGSKHWGNAITRICTWTRLEEMRSGCTFHLYNLHLDHISQLSREKSVLALADKIRSREHGDPLVVTGDFNADEKNAAIRFLKGHDLPGFAQEKQKSVRLIDTYRVIHPADTIVGTFHAFRGNRTGGKIDYIFVEPSAIVRDAAILYDNDGGRYPSDHFPVTARVVLPAFHR